MGVGECLYPELAGNQARSFELECHITARGTHIHNTMIIDPKKISSYALLPEMLVPFRMVIVKIRKSHP